VSQEGAPQVRRLAHPIEERQYVPRLAAPSRRSRKTSSDAPNMARAPARLGRVVGAAIAALLLVGAAAAAYLLLR
jgi:hypothetical protein